MQQFFAPRYLVPFQLKIICELIKLRITQVKSQWRKIGLSMKINESLRNATNFLFAKELSLRTMAVTCPLIFSLSKYSWKN